jgi:hypothetical protein
MVHFIDLPEELKFDRLSVEEKYYRAVPGYMKRLCRLYEAVYERFGEAGLDLIRHVSREFGTGIGENVRKKHRLKGIAEVGRYLLKVFDMITDEWSVSEYTRDRLIIKVTRCPYPFSNDKICQAHTCMEQALVATLDKNLEYSVARSIPRGDPFCEHLLCDRGSSD